MEVRLSLVHSTRMIFHSQDRAEARIDIDHEIVLTRGEQELTLAGARTGVHRRPRELSPLVELIGSHVTEALAHTEGSLHLAFDNKWSLTVTPEVWEGWHFAGMGHYLHGDDGQLR